jgi:hypothetical protein
MRYARQAVQCRGPWSVGLLPGTQWGVPGQVLTASLRVWLHDLRVWLRDQLIKSTVAPGFP